MKKTLKKNVVLNKLTPPMQFHKVEIEIKKSLLVMTKNAAGSRQFRNLFAKVDGVSRDIMRNGDVSCPGFISATLLMFELIKHPHATVGGLITDMEQSGWVKIKSPKAASIIIWEKLNGKSGEDHAHCGIYLGNKKAVSNSSKLGTPRIHDWRYGKKNRKIIASFWHPKLGK